MSEVPTILQGAEFSYTVQLSENVTSGQFTGYTIFSQARIKGNRLPSGLLADLIVTPIDQVNNIYLIHHPDTAKWPVGEIEIDIVFVHPTSGRKIYSLPKVLKVLPTITKIRGDC